MTRRSIEISSFQHANPIPCATRIGPLIDRPPSGPGFGNWLPTSSLPTG